MAEDATLDGYELDWMQEATVNCVVHGLSLVDNGEGGIGTHRFQVLEDDRVLVSGGVHHGLVAVNVTPEGQDFDAKLEEKVATPVRDLLERRVARGMSLDGLLDHQTITDYFDNLQRIKDSGMNLFIVGMMSTGKSTQAEMLARAIGFDFVDTDTLIFEQFSEKPGDIAKRANELGTDEFARKQRDAILSYTPERPVIGATGGSVPKYPELIEHLNTFATIGLIDASLPVLKKRISEEKQAGLNFSPGITTFDGEYDYRMPIYREVTPYHLQVVEEQPRHTTHLRLVDSTGRSDGWIAQAAA